MPVTAHCPQCKRLAYLSGGKCEFCGYELPPEVVGRIVGREIVRETRPTETPEEQRQRRHTVHGYRLDVRPEEWPLGEIDLSSAGRQIFEAEDQLNTVFVALSRRKDLQREAADLARILETLSAFRVNIQRRFEI